MSDSETTKKVSNNDLRNSQFAGSLVDAETVNITNTINIGNDEIQLRQILIEVLKPIIETDVLSEKVKLEVINYFKENKNYTNTVYSLFRKNDEYKIEYISNSQTVYAHYLIAKYLEKIKVRCHLAISITAEALKNIDISDFYEDEFIYQAIQAFCGNLFICIDWLYESIIFFSALPLSDETKEVFRDCQREIFESAFNILIIEAENWTDNSEVPKEVSKYLNILLQKIYN
ncbi:hypothetical protein [Anabaena azotica]|uniref:Uncharacterized protein n=1 Tax=Anabaena azotica FACHB-119 TaxID=947527 RepID=A0ABR8DE21_9NOST|nr:hypothetical protein [Anabaena azotica]MBD2504866.1 hypothetical protein [Anabaena azotica FACHB-119]